MSKLTEMVGDREGKRGGGRERMRDNTHGIFDMQIKHFDTEFEN